LLAFPSCPKSLALASSLEKVSRLASDPADKNSKPGMLPELPHLAIVAGKLIFVQQSVYLPVADSMKPNRLHATP
jgi:hypothetical protein